MSKIKVLIPYASYASGHKTTAQSIAKHLEQKDYDFVVGIQEFVVKNL